MQLLGVRALASALLAASSSTQAGVASRRQILTRGFIAAGSGANADQDQRQGNFQLAVPNAVDVQYGASSEMPGFGHWKSQTKEEIQAAEAARDKKTDHYGDRSADAAGGRRSKIDLDYKQT